MAGVKGRSGVYIRTKPVWNKGKVGVQTAWNKGLTKETDSRVLRNAQKIAEGVRKKIAEDPIYMDQVVKAYIMKLRAIHQSNQIKPNRTEQQLLDCLNELFPGEYRYVGDGEFILGGKCPDFVNVNGRKQIIELFGEYWHAGEDSQTRINYFRRYGYETLVIWEKELKDKYVLTNRLKEFNLKGG